MCNFCELGHQDVTDEKIPPEDFNLKVTDVIHKEEKWVKILALSSMLASRCVGQGRMTMAPVQGRGSKISLQLDSGGSKSAGTYLSWSSISLGITEQGSEGRRRPQMGRENTTLIMPAWKTTEVQRVLHL